MVSSTSTGTKRKVSEVIEKCPLDMDGLFTYANLNILPLGSYDILIGMDWKHTRLNLTSTTRNLNA